MADKTLPIKLFSKRENKDERRTEGGGNDEFPAWVLVGEQLLVKADELRESLSETAELIANRNPERDFIPVVIKVSLKGEATAKSHRTEAGKIFNRKNEYNFIGLVEDLDLLVTVESRDHLSFIAENLGKPRAFAWGISAIQEIEPFKPEIDLPLEEGDPIKVKLINYQDRRLNEVVEQVFEQTLNQLNVAIDRKTRYSSQVTVFKLSNVQADALEQIQEFEALYSITPMPSYSVTQDEVGTGSSIQVKEPVPGEEYPVVGILDSGIEAIDHLRPWLEPNLFTVYAEEDVDRAHGTFVAGVVAYGDELENEQWVGKTACRLFDATVFPRPGVSIDEDELVDNIRSAIHRHSDIKIWNLSLGSKTECDHLEFSDFGIALDDIQDTYDVQICKSAGNCDNFARRQPKRRIAKSADSIRSLVVASMAHVQGEHDLALEGYPSPFSRVGFAANNLVKPDVTHFGGNGGIKPDGKVTHSGVNSFSVSGKIVQKAGTSFSTPRAAAIMAGLNHRLAEEFDPLLLKSLLIHSAKYPDHLTLSPTDRLKEMGYGRPSSVEDIVYNSPNEITLVLRDTIVKGGYIEILDFPYPDELVNSDGEYYGEVILTLVSGTYLDGRQGGEYCQSNIKVSFGTYDHVVERDTSKPTILNPLGKGNAFNVLLPRHYAQRFRRYSSSRFTAERQLRDYSGKFHPVKKFAINLSEITPGSRRAGLMAPKRWFLRLDGLFAQATEVAASNNGEELAQDFALIVTIRDPTNRHDVYSSVVRSLTANNFQHSDVRVRNEVKINLRNNLGNQG